MLIMSIASHSGHLTLAPGAQWIGSYPAMAAFGAATFLEIAAYYIPWIDNLLDTVAAPAAVIAGTIVMSSAVSDMSPFFRWSLGFVAGGGSAGAVQLVTSMTRGASSLTTAGLANPLVSTFEMGGSAGLSLIAIALPVLAGLTVIGILLLVAVKVLGKFSRGKENKSAVNMKA
jgi:hypothetical protein